MHLIAIEILKNVLDKNLLRFKGSTIKGMGYPFNYISEHLMTVWVFQLSEIHWWGIF